VIRYRYLATPVATALLCGCLRATPGSALPAPEPAAACAELPFTSCRVLSNYAQSDPAELLLELPELGPEASQASGPWFEPLGAMPTALDPVFAREWQRPF
jgi:hypothetical protein